MHRSLPTRRPLFEALEGRTFLTITPAHVALAQRSVAETTPANNLYTNGNYTVNWTGLNGKTSTVTQADCTTYVTALLKQAYGTDFYGKFGANSPSLTRYYDEAVADGALDGFKQIADVKIGDYFIVRYLDAGAPARGHMVMFEKQPTYAGTTKNKAGQTVKYYHAQIIDVTGSPHSGDTRTDANQDGTNDTGVGRGNIRLYTDTDGNIQYWAWGTSSGSTTYDNPERPCLFFKVPAMTINAPVGLAATALGETSAKLTWTDRSGIEDGYAIERTSDNGATWSYVGDVNKNVSTFTDTTVIPGAYTYRVYAVAGSSQSNVSAANLTVNAIVPTLPANFTAVLSGTKVNLTWTDTATNETGYLLERSANDGAFAPLLTLSANASGYVDAPAFGYRYTYRLTAVTPYAQSAESNVSLNLAVRRTPVPPRPTPPPTAGTATVAVAPPKSMPVLKPADASMVAVAPSAVRISVLTDVLAQSLLYAVT